MNNSLVSETRKRDYRGWVELAVCLIFLTISYGVQFSFGVFFKSLEQEFNWTRALTSSVFSAYMLFCSVFAILFSWLADRHGPKIIFMSMGFLSFFGLGLTSLANTPWQLFASYSLLVAAGTGPAYAIASSIAIKWFVQRRGLALAIVTSGVGLGSILFVPFAAYLINGFGWRITYLVIGVVALISMTPLSLLLKIAPTDQTLPHSTRQPAVKVTVSNATREKSKWVFIFQIIRERNYVLIFSIWFFYSFCLFMIMTHLVRHAIDLGIDSIQAATLISISGFANIPARITMGLVSDRFGTKRTALICASIMAIAILWLTQSSSLWMLYVFAIVFGAAYGGLAPPTSAIVGDTFGASRIGFIFSTLGIGWACGAAAGPALAGYIYDVTGEYYLAFLIGLFGSLIIVALAFLLRVPIPNNHK